MKRMRLIVLFAALTVMTAGVQLVHAACPSTQTLYYPSGRYHCYLTSTDADGWCNYNCTFVRIVFV